jgi:hypothetical protein
VLRIFYLFINPAPVGLISDDAICMNKKDNCQEQAKHIVYLFNEFPVLMCDKHYKEYIDWREVE